MACPPIASIRPHGPDTVLIAQTHRYWVLQGHELVRIEDAYVLDLDDIAASRVIREFQEKLAAKAKHSTLEAGD